ncbi:unnamed protein product, partial [Rodentolepis nana]|uniref:Bis(5'-adenosyl)-triphosphatase enpp4 n=1 Tax=Rodentolepis nana TaxID=102285 RepID=A0A0R3T3K5_RODNA
MRFISALVVLFFGICLGSKIILFSFDGFRHDYIEKAKAQNKNVSAFEYLEREGFRGMQVHSIMPSLTFPSHFAIVTGRNAENHGLVGNTFYDPTIKDSYSYKNVKNQLDSNWFEYNNNEPLWLSIQRHGGKCGIMYWPGSYSRINDKMAYVDYGLYSAVPSLRFRVDRAMDWITKPDVNCVLIYFNEPDSSGHNSGPDSEKVLSAIEQCNEGLAYLIERINESKNLPEKPNIIVTSDHGMTTVNISVVVPIHKYLPPEEYMSGVDGSPATLGIWPLPKGKSVDVLYEKVKKAETEFGHCKVYKKEEIPDEY